MPTLRSFTMFLAVLSVLFGFVAPIAAQEATPATGEITILGPDESYAGATLSEWSAREWQWIASFPPEVSPGTDTTGERCGLGQSGPIFFLPGTFTPEPQNITCVVPEGMAILVGLGSSGCSSVEPPPFFGQSEEELRTCAEPGADEITGLAVSINDQEVLDPMQYRFTTPLFTMTFPEENVFDAPAGVALSVSSGYGFILAPLPPGEYEIMTSMAFEGDTEPFVGTIRVIVEAPKVVEPAPGPEAATPVN